MARLLPLASVAAFGLISVPPGAAAGRLPSTLVELRPAGVFMAAPAVRRAGGIELAPSVAIWRVPPGRGPLLAQLRRLRLLRWTRPERTLAHAAVRVAPDPLSPGEWWRDRVGADSIEPPGPGIAVTVIDTGVDLAHPEFAGRPDTVALNVQRITDSDKDFHGTAVASVAGAPANGVGLVGIYPALKLQLYDADLLGRVTDGELIGAIDAAAATGPGVINLSLGSPDFDQPLQDAIYSAFKRGSLVVAASGNSRTAGNPINFPANMSHVLTVGATDRTDRAAAFSSTSRGVDLAAPGVEIPAALPTAFARTGYANVDGTSFSAPLVSGATAWVWTSRPTLNNTQIFDVMRWSARDVGAAGFDEETGFGILDVPAALAEPAPRPDPQEPNDDVALVKPGALFAHGTSPLTAPGRPRATVRARVDVTEDPADVYRVWIPARRTLVATLRGEENVDLALWKPATRTVRERGKALRRDRAASSALPRTRVDVARALNPDRRGAYFYAAVAPAYGVGGASYTLTVTTR